MMRSKDIHEYISSYFLNYLPLQKGCSYNTIKSYRDAICIFIKYLRDFRKIKPEKLRFSNINRTVVEEYLTWLEENKQCSISTRNQRLATLHAFFRYLQIEAPQYLDLCKSILTIRSKKAPQKLINYLSVEEIKIFLSMVDTKTKQGRRELSILSLLYDSGARVQELLDLSVVNIRCLKPATVRFTGKGNKTRIVPIMPQAIEILKKYMLDYGLCTGMSSLNPLFFNKQGKKLSDEGVSYIIDKYVVKGREERPDLFKGSITPHTFRHSKAMHLVEANVNLIYIRDFLGHSSVVTTEHYAKANPEVKRKAIEKAGQNVLPENIYSVVEKEDLINWLKNNI